MAVVDNFYFSIFLRLTWEFLGLENKRGGSVCWPNNKIINRCSKNTLPDDHKLYTISSVWTWRPPTQNVLTISFARSGDPTVDYLTKKMQINWETTLLWDWREKNKGRCSFQAITSFGVYTRLQLFQFCVGIKSSSSCRNS
jgi:hypothetical protein